MDGTFGALNNVAWTSIGPVAVSEIDDVRMKLRKEGRVITVHGLDKFPRMTDYVIPSGVRIADADRVRLGAHLAEGTTVMHEGFCNFNAGTLGVSMVEGRISAGVVVGDGSRHRRRRVDPWARCRAAAPSRSRSASAACWERTPASASASATTAWSRRVCTSRPAHRCSRPQGVVKARELSGQDRMMFIRDGQSGKVVARARLGSWGALNDELHTGQ